jgi:hypothetical protein
MAVLNLRLFEIHLEPECLEEEFEVFVAPADDGRNLLEDIALQLSKLVELLNDCMFLHKIQRVFEVPRVKAEESHGQVHLIDLVFLRLGVGD